MDVILSNGEKIPRIGFGTWQLNDKDTLLAALECAYLNGYRHFDTAKIYGNEEIIGQFLTTKPRSEMFVTSKLWIDSCDNVQDACDISLKKLQLDYLDLYLVHWPINSVNKFDLAKVWSQMEKLVETKRVRSIGISNFGPKRIEELLNFCKIKPVVLQIEQHPYLPQTELIKFCFSNNISVVGYSTLGSSGTSNKLVREDPIILDIAQKHNCKPSQILLGWSLYKGCIVIPRSSNELHIKENIKIVKLEKEDMDMIDKISYRCRYVDMAPEYDLSVFE